MTDDINEFFKVLKLLNNFKGEVKCPICSKSVQQSITTKCNHSFCEKCFNKATAAKKKLKCPLCRIVITKKTNIQLQSVDKISTVMQCMHKKLNEQFEIDVFNKRVVKSVEIPKALLSKQHESDESEDPFDALINNSTARGVKRVYERKNKKKNNVSHLAEFDEENADNIDESRVEKVKQWLGSGVNQFERKSQSEQDSINSSDLEEFPIKSISQRGKNKRYGKRKCQSLRSESAKEEDTTLMLRKTVATDSPEDANISIEEFDSNERRKIFNIFEERGLDNVLEMPVLQPELAKPLSDWDKMKDISKASDTQKKFKATDSPEDENITIEEFDSNERRNIINIFKVRGLDNVIEMPVLQPEVAKPLSGWDKMKDISKASDTQPKFKDLKVKQKHKSPIKKNQKLPIKKNQKSPIKILTNIVLPQMNPAKEIVSQGISEYSILNEELVTGINNAIDILQHEEDKEIEVVVIADNNDEILKNNNNEYRRDHVDVIGDNTEIEINCTSKVNIKMNTNYCSDEIISETPSKKDDDSIFTVCTQVLDTTNEVFKINSEVNEWLDTFATLRKKLRFHTANETAVHMLKVFDKLTPLHKQIENILDGRSDITLCEVDGEIDIEALRVVKKDAGINTDDVKKIHHATNTEVVQVNAATNTERVLKVNATINTEHLYKLDLGVNTEHVLKVDSTTNTECAQKDIIERILEEKEKMNLPDSQQSNKENINVTANKPTKQAHLLDRQLSNKLHVPITTNKEPLLSNKNASPKPILQDILPRNVNNANAKTPQQQPQTVTQILDLLDKSGHSSDVIEPTPLKARNTQRVSAAVAAAPPPPAEPSTSSFLASSKVDSPKRIATPNKSTQRSSGARKRLKYSDGEQLAKSKFKRIRTISSDDDDDDDAEVKKVVKKPFLNKHISIEFDSEEQTNRGNEVLQSENLSMEYLEHVWDRIRKGQLAQPKPVENPKPAPQTSRSIPKTTTAHETIEEKCDKIIEECTKAIFQKPSQHEVATTSNQVQLDQDIIEAFDEPFTCDDESFYSPARVEKSFSTDDTGSKKLCANLLNSSTTTSTSSRKCDADLNDDILKAMDETMSCDVDIQTPIEKTIEKNGSEVISLSDDELFGDDVIESTPEKQLPTTAEGNVTVENVDAAAICDRTFTPPPGFQDIADDDDHDKTIDCNDDTVICTNPDTTNRADLTFSGISDGLVILSPIRPSGTRSAIALAHTPAIKKRSASTPNVKQAPITHFMKKRQQFSEDKFEQMLKSPLVKAKPCISGTRLSNDQITVIKSLESRQLVSYTAAFSTNVTHLIVNVNKNNCVVDHTMKFINAVANGIWVLNFKWVQQCLEQNKLIAEEPFEVNDVSGVPGPRDARLLHNTKPLFKGFRIYVAAPLVTTTQAEVESVIKLLGGKIAPNAEDLFVKGNDICVIITEMRCSQDEEKYNHWLENLQVITVDLEWFSRTVGQYKLLSLKNFSLNSEETLQELGELGYPNFLIENIPITQTQSTSFLQ